jgi:2-hydroxy-3-oxopropionate reductase
MSTLPNTADLKIGFIGLGIMGAPMAEQLIKAGHQLFVYTRGKLSKTIAQAATTVCPTAASVGELADVIFLMLPNTPDVEAVLFGQQGLTGGLGISSTMQKSEQRKVVIDMSSISPVATKLFAKKINDLGCDYLDAPVSGGEVGAKNATLSIMVGGEKNIFELIKPLFELMGKNITLIGGNGDGQTAKVANQIVVALNIEAVAEALLFSAKAGADPARVRQALMGGFASSKVLEVHGERMIKRTFDPGFRIELHQKDLNLALSTAKSLNISLPNTATAQELMNSCSAYGGGNWDHSAMVKALEKMANFEIG